jgi:RNA polymerase sigma-70 factor (sigma-E family)
VAHRCYQMSPRVTTDGKIVLCVTGPSLPTESGRPSPGSVAAGKSGYRSNLTRAAAICSGVDIDTRARRAGLPDASVGVTELYQAHAVGLIKLGVIMLGDRTAAEDVVQDAFFGLYRNWGRLSDPDNALAYARASVLNGCRAALRQRIRRERRLSAVADATTAESAESAVLLGEEHREVLAAVRRLPDRQREALVLRFYLGVSEEETARAMGISRGTVKSSTSRALAALGRMLKEES